MDSHLPIAEDVYWIGVNDRETALFEGLWPLPRGVSYNSYLIVDEKIAVVDTVKAMKSDQYVANLRALVPAGKGIDYLIVNHMEPDHSGSIALLRDLYPGIVVIGNDKTARLLGDFFGIVDNVQVVRDGDTLPLGRRTLQFHLTPMVHWPETMVSYEMAGKILFSGDAFGGFGALTGGIFDDEVDVAYFEDEILRYFSNIVGKYASMVQKAIAKLAGLEIALIAPTHGPVWRRDPGHILDLYDRWSRHEGEPGVVLVYGSMYGNSCQMMEAVARGLTEADMPKVRIHSVSTTHISYLIRDAWRYCGLVLGAPTYDMGLYPPMSFLVEMLGRKKLRRRTLGLFGTYGWSGGGVKALRAFAEEGEWDLVEPVVEACCHATASELEDCRALGRNMARRILGG